MTLGLAFLIAWLSVMPLCFGAMALLMPRHLHRRASAVLSAAGAEVVQLQAVRERRSRSLPPGSSRAS